MSLRIVIAEDSAIFAEVLLDVLRAEPGIEIVAMTDNGVDVVNLCEEHRPDLVLMDIHMPRQDGLAATEAIMARCPTPILVVTADPHRGGVDLSFKALSAGALDLMPKPQCLPFPEGEREALLRKIRLLSQIPVVRHVRGRKRQGIERPRLTPQTTPRNAADRPVAVVGVVASTGGPRALAGIVGQLPADFPAAITVVQHITHGFSTHLAHWLDNHSPLTVVEAREGMALKRGHLYIAPTERHMMLEPDLKLSVVEGPPVGGHCPSGDRLLTSLARHAAPRAIGVILSGMGDDGTVGLTAMHHTGCPTLAQDETSSVVYGMPRSAIAHGVIDRVVDIDQLADALIREVEKLQQRERA
ncbi:chemotaxis response regulator protein-glutamate methylesterase [Lujinxingia litoralis]|uniref:Protein-glutamate methylesterase/protein-glutamine glutaminase n=1 Tax=Lujinxingia litoralis TaxID=2211119 RepID=A0A328CDE9_9DELT|nr:chemotaxis-specific protein-glutamate methyltransferase CheB [Lujinxingia litoralis]RAL24969.1 chemotaxis response regulator protein-glutamate methylesterase [Lujinxingia litoralis]